MSKQLTIGDILDCVESLKQNKSMSLTEIKKLPIYLGEDDELNGIHTAWYCDLIDSGEDAEYFRELIDEDRGNIQLADDEKAILIS